MYIIIIINIKTIAGCASMSYFRFHKPIITIVPLELLENINQNEQNKSNKCRE